MGKIINFIVIVLLFLFGLYSIIGTYGNVDLIKSKFQTEVTARNRKIERYEGFQLGSYSCHGGKVWYHVSNIDNKNIQYRVKVCIWNGELQYYYGGPEDLTRIEYLVRD